MGEKIQIQLVTEADTKGADQAGAALKEVSNEAQALSSSANAAAHDVGILDAALDRLKARRKQMVQDGAQGDLEGFTRRGYIINKTIDRLQSRRDAAAKSPSETEDLTTSYGKDFLNTAKQVSTTAEDFPKNLASLAKTLSKAAIAISAGVAIGDEIQKNWFNWKTSMAAGGLSTETDQRKAQEAISIQGEAISNFYQRAKAVASTADKYSLMDDVAAYQKALIEQKSKLAVNETAQKAAIDQSVSNLQVFWSEALNLDPAALGAAQEKIAADKQRAIDQAADQASRARFSEAMTAEENRMRFAALSPEEKKQSLASRISSDSQVADSAPGGQYSNEQRDAARERVVRMTRELSQIEAQITAEKEKQAQKDAEAAAKTEEATSSLRTRLQVEAFRAQGNDAAADRAETVLSIEKELDGLRKSGVTDEKLLDEYSSQKLAAYDQQLAKKHEELDLETRLNEAKALGNKEEEAKLQWLKEYNQLQSQGFSEEEARRSANAQSAAQLADRKTDDPAGGKSHYVAPGELFSGSNRRRGATESDAMGESTLNLAPGQSLLDQYKANKDRAVGAVGGRSILPDDPKSAMADAAGKSGKGGKGNDAAGAAKSLEATLQKELSGVAKALTDATKNTTDAGIKSAMANLGAAIKAKDDSLQQQIDSLAAQIA